MKILVDSVEYKCWHEVGHAAVCLYLGGDVKLIDVLVGNTSGNARTRCVVTSSEIESIVACGSFATEVVSLKKGYAEQDSDDKKNVSQVVNNNATNHREDFWGRKLGTDEVFTEP